MRHFRWTIGKRVVKLNLNGPSKLREMGIHFCHYIPTHQWGLQVSFWWAEIYLWIERPDSEERAQKDIDDFMAKLKDNVTV